MGTTVFLSRSGCLPCRIFITLEEDILGHTQLRSLESFALANMKSSLDTISTLVFSKSAILATIPVSSIRILSISCCSLITSDLISLLVSTTDRGSMNTVAPLADISWIRPGTIDLYSCLTGMTYRSPRMVTTASCMNFR